jgi:hypothetical protein
MRWFLIGKLPTGEAVLCSEQGSFAKECDHEYLVELSQEEKGNIISENYFHFRD